METFNGLGKYACKSCDKHNEPECPLLSITQGKSSSGYVQAENHCGNVIIHYGCLFYNKQLTLTEMYHKVLREKGITV